MAREYLKVFGDRGLPVEVVGRDAGRAGEVGAAFGIPARGGGVESIGDLSGYAGVVVATGVAELAAAATAAVDQGARALLVEKPGALYRRELEELAARAHGLPAWVAYNRRFFPSVEAARARVDADGGLLAATFEFTELAGRVLPVMGARPDAAALLPRLGVVNSLHVIDLFLHLAGLPSDWWHTRGGGLEWHPAGSVFCGAGTTDAGVHFSYLATWGGAGRWGLELTTDRHRLVLRPLEQLRVQERDSFDVAAAALPREPAALKPGLGGVVDAFAAAAGGGAPDPRLPRLAEALRHYAVAEAILGYA
jgi:predicted dehydrogenase